MDQAEELRNVIKKQNQRTKKPARIITVTSGKGGVGKSNIAVNLAVQFQRMGLKTIIFDADIGLANVEVMFGTIPQYNPHNSKENNDKESGCTEKTSSSEKAGREKITCKSSKERSGAGDDSAVRRKRNQGERSVRENPADLDRRIWQESRRIKEPEGLCKTGGIYCLLRNQ